MELGKQCVEQAPGHPLLDDNYFGRLTTTILAGCQ
jgi:hypothetical protein